MVGRLVCSGVKKYLCPPLVLLNHNNLKIKSVLSRDRERVTVERKNKLGWCGINISGSNIHDL